MARYDAHTNKFMTDVAGEKPKTDSGDVAKTSLVTLKGLLTTKNPLAVAARMGAAHVADKAFDEKKAGAGPIKIYQLLNDRYGRSWFDWEPETLWQSISDDLGTSADEELKNIVMALQVLVNTNQAHEHWHIFENVVHAFNLNSVDFSIVQPSELDEIAYAMKVINTVRPREKFEPEISGYIAAAARNSGVVFLPRDLFCAGCQTFLDGVNNDLELRAEVENRWPSAPKNDDSLPLKVQLLRLKEIEDYVKGGPGA